MRTTKEQWNKRHCVDKAHDAEKEVNSVHKVK